MEVQVPQSIKLSSWIDTERFLNKHTGGFLQLPQRRKEHQCVQMVISTQLPKRNSVAYYHKPLTLEVSCAYKKFPASVLESGGFPASLDEMLTLKNKSQEIESYLNGHSIYLVGMMGSGKSTVGRILSDVLGYSFLDCDVMIEQAAGGISVADIFKLHGEGYFRDNETEVLRKLSSMQRLVVSTGGGAVVRPINWKHMRRGISVWLDVPLEALARRISAVGTASRPLLHQESGDAYSKTYTRLSTLMEERRDAYANAKARVSLECVARKLGYCDVSNITPAAIATEALDQIERLLKKDGIAN